MLPGTIAASERWPGMSQSVAAGRRLEGGGLGVFRVWSFAYLQVGGGLWEISAIHGVD